MFFFPGLSILSIKLRLEFRKDVLNWSSDKRCLENFYFE